MSNYPPGVSGFEPEIAGYDERDNTRTMSCTHDDTPHYDADSDGFNDDVEGTDILYPGYGIGFYWECPVCGLETETEMPLDEPYSERY